MHLVIYLQSSFVTCELSNFVKAQFGEIGAFQENKTNGKAIITSSADMHAWLLFARLHRYAEFIKEGRANAVWTSEFYSG